MFIVLFKLESKLVKFDVWWVFLVLNVEKGIEIIKLDSFKKDENQGIDY